MVTKDEYIVSATCTPSGEAKINTRYKTQQRVSFIRTITRTVRDIAFVC